MGLERVAAILQGKLSNYESDLIAPIVSRAAELLSVSEGVDAATDAALRIAADHSRAATFLIHDGVVPSNEGRGYVLRKILRRAMRHARRIGRRGPVPVQAHRLCRRPDEARLSGTAGERPARGPHR